MKLRTTGTFWLLTIIVVGLLLRLYRIDVPLLDPKPHREIHTAEETRNLYQDGQLLLPKARVWGDEPGYYLAEFPIYNAVVAWVYHATDDVNETAGRLVSALSSVGVVVFLYLFVKKYFGVATAVWSAAFFYLVSPQEIILSRSFQPDQLGLMLGMASLYLFSQWVNGKNGRFFATSFILFTIMLLVRVQLFFFGFPMLFLAWRAWEKNILKQPLLWIYGLTAIPTLLWSIHVRNVYMQFPQLHSAGLLDPRSWLQFDNLLNPRWLVNTGFGFVEQVVTIPVALLFVLGLVVAGKKQKALLVSWMIGLGVYALLFIGKIHFWYYQVPFLFPIVIFAALAVVAIAPHIGKRVRFPRVFAAVFVAIVMALTARPYVLRTYAIGNRHRAVLETAQHVRQRAGINSKILASSYNSAALTYYSLRPDIWGATLDINQPGCTGTCTIAAFESWRNWGAQLYAVSDKDEFVQNPVFYQYLQNTYTPLVETDTYVIYDLTP